MRRTTIGFLALSAMAVAGCGGSSKFANQPRPATPVDLTVYINDSRVSVSPSSVGAGPVIFIVSNQSTHAQSLTVLPAGSTAAQPLANAGPINPQATAEFTVNFTGAGNYTVTTAANSGTDATSVSSSIQPATLHIGPRRATSGNVLLQP
jgi:hypothetical protein